MLGILEHCHCLVYVSQIHYKMYFNFEHNYFETRCTKIGVKIVTMYHFQKYFRTFLPELNANQLASGSCRSE